MTTLAQDTFTRTVAAGGWGTADTGQAWTITTTPSVFSVDGAEGVIAQTSSIKTCLATLGITPAQDVDITFDWETDGIPSGGVWGLRIYPRYVGGAADYHARLTVASDATSVTLGIYNSDAAIITSPVPIPLTYVAGSRYHVQAQAIGISPTTIKARAWKDGDAVPDWQVVGTDSTAALQVSAVPGLRVGGSSAPLTAHFDNLTVTDGTTVDPAVGHVAYMAVTQPDSTSLPVGVAFTDATATADVVLSRTGAEVDRKTVTVSTNGFAHALFTGLPAGTQHTVTVEIGGVEQTDRSLVIATQPDAGSFVFVAGSCQFTGSNHPVFDRMLAANPAFISHAGDLQYDNATDAPTWLAAERASLSAARFRGLLERTPIARTWDNHDRIIADKGGGGLPLNMGTTDPQTNTLWREFAGAFPVTGVVGQTWTTGRVRFIQTDGWTVRDDPDVDPEPRTFLGAAQKQWFKDTLAAATEPLIVWFCQWTAQENANGRWASFPSETAELEAWMDAHPDVKARMVMIGGDSHSLQADDGSRTRSDTVFNGIPSLNISGFNRSGDTVDGTVWSIANLPLRTSAQPEADWGGFSRVTITDTGADVGFAWEGVRVDSSGTEDVMASWSKDFPTPATDLFKWSGDDQGGFDHEATAFNPAFVYDQDGDNASLLFTPTGTAFLGKSPLGSPAQVALRFALKLSGYPTSSNPILAPLTSGGSSAWRVRLSSTGTLIIDDPTNAVKGTSAAIPLGQWVLVKILATATTITLRIYDAKRGGMLIGSEVIASGSFGLMDNLRIGQGSNTPIIPPYRIDDILVTDGATWLPDPTAPDPITQPTLGIIGDSLTAMSGANGSYLYDALTTAGMSTRSTYLWGVGGKKIQAADLTGKTSIQNIQDAQNSLGPFGTWIVALGTNDRPSDDATVNAAIDSLLAKIGTGPRVVWIGLTSKGSASADDIRVNGLIQAKLAARGNATFADWDSHIRAIDGGANPSPYWQTVDNTHMTPEGYQIRAQFYVDQVKPASPQPWSAVYVGDTLAHAVYVGAEQVWP